MSKNITLHIDDRPEMRLRSQIFGHPGVIIPFTEGFVGKQQPDPIELNFYQSYNTSSSLLFDSLPKDVVPELEGIGSDSEIDKTFVRLKLTKTFSENDIPHCQVLLLKDLAAGYSHPAVLDIKLGVRTWELGANPDKIERRKVKYMTSSAGKMDFRIRAAIWHSSQPKKWKSYQGISYVTRDFGNRCTQQEMILFFIDFFHFPNLIPFYIQKLREIHSALSNLKEKTDVRFFSTSVLFAFDEDDPTKMDCRLLDFAKTYFNIKKTAAKYNEDINDCEDLILPALEHLIEILDSLQQKF